MHNITEYMYTAILYSNTPTPLNKTPMSVHCYITNKHQDPADLHSRSMEQQWTEISDINPGYDNYWHQYEKLGSTREGKQNLFTPKISSSILIDLSTYKPLEVTIVMVGYFF